MNLQYVRSALEIARPGSISRAADNLSVAQPNLSRAVKELEGQLGIAIFDRTRKGMVLTPEGERLLTAGERVLRDVDALEAMCTEGKAERVLLIVARGNVIHPLLVVEIPADGFFDAFFELERWFPAEFLLEFG